jgi:hypothetical protein
MTKRIPTYEPTVKRLRDSAPSMRRLDPKTVAADLSAHEFTLSARQVASVLLSMVLRSVTTGLNEDAVEQADYTAVLAKELAACLGTENSR